MRILVPPFRACRSLYSSRQFSICSRAWEKHSTPTRPQPEDAPKAEAEKKSRPASRQTSLRRAVLEAERARGNLIRRKGNIRFVDPGVDTLKVTAYCAAEQYDMPRVARLLKMEGYQIDPFQTSLYPQVIHVQAKALPDASADPTGDIFIFPSGTLVVWNVSERMAQSLLSSILLKASVGPQTKTLETETMEYIEDPRRENSDIVGDTIVLGTKMEAHQQHMLESSSTRTEDTDTSVNSVLAKIAFSSGLARSTKLAVLESLLSSYFEATREIPSTLSKGIRSRLFSHSPFTRSKVLRKTGELLNIRAQLNLDSELTDSLPDLFWDSRHELGLEGYYDQVAKALDVNVRIKSLNEKMDYAQDIASVLREQLSERHGLLLEWGIIALIAIEVVFELIRLRKESQEHNNPESTEKLLRQFLYSHLRPSGTAETKL